MKKVYDRLEWDYQQKIMIKLGFHRLCTNDYENDQLIVILSVV